ncbi:TPA: hypothetical protein ACP32N_005122 [Pseudomonas aeruginosa]
MFNPKQFTLSQLATDELPDSLPIGKVLELLSATHTAAVDERSDVDEARIKGLRKALADIEKTSKDPVIALVARRALTNDED